VLHDLAAETGETITLWAVEGDAFTVVDGVESTQTLRGTIPIGYLASVTEGGDFLAFCDALTRDRLLGPGAMTDEHLALVRGRGYYVVDTEYTSTIAVGAPVWDGRPLPAAAVLLVAPADRMRGDALAAAGAQVAEAAAGLSSGRQRRAG
jgi:DNA-binding IclR family transcriptional regulator